MRGTNAQAIMTPELKKKLFSAVKIPYLKLTDLEAVAKDKVMPEDLLTEGVLFRLGMLRQIFPLEFHSYARNLLSLL